MPTIIEPLREDWAAVQASALLLAALLLSVRQIGHGSAAEGDDTPGFTLPARGVALIAVLCFLVMITEGAMADWSGLYLRQDLGASAAVAALAYSFFTGGMTVGRLVGDAVEGMPWLGTFHAIAAKMLRRHAELVGLQSNFTILDTDDQLRLLKQLILAADIDEKRFPTRSLAGLIDQWKNKGLVPADIDAGESERYANGRGGELYEQYQTRLRALNACDFGDLLLVLDHHDSLAHAASLLYFRLFVFHKARRPR